MKEATTCGTVRNHKRGEGFTLIEVMVALGILAFGILAIASMQTASLGGISLAGNTTEATTIAMNQLEQLIPLAYTNPALSVGTYSPTTQGQYTVNYSVAAGPLTNTRYIRVTVQWDEKGAQKTTGLTYVKMDVI
ncbi:MAG: prepilin-type N-terminal cleavage/methylation domain-containing protein [Deltaproteobacteria bacterium]|nr:prepilin-type N-terminal cleavage/methylation domain-containing protein [Deltaproteobacteria bacterium]